MARREVNVLWVVAVVAGVGVAAFGLIEHRAGGAKTALTERGRPVYADPDSPLRVYYVEGAAPARREIRLVGVPPSVVALQSAPARREPGLNRGDWLVMTFHVTDMNGVMCIREAVRVAERLGGRVTVGVRPCLYQEEADTWAGGWGADPNTPLWLVLRNGQEVGRERGPLMADDIERLTRATLGW